MNKFLPALIFALFLACGPLPDTNDAAPPTDRVAMIANDDAPTLFGGELTDYWYQGKAELTTYDLQQARYGELRQGEAVLIQVSEDFLTDKQVKNDAYENTNSTPILKTNLFKRFTTGIYDYSLMTSVFTPTKTDEFRRTLKVTTSVQDWCGQTYTQLNYGGGGSYTMQLRSYFEREADQDVDLDTDFLEDEIFNRIRVGGELPVGTYKIIPATGYLLMTHQAYEAATAETDLQDVDADTKRYTVDYPELSRRLEVTFDAASPYVIRQWTETYPSRDTLLTTTATLRQQRMEAYWGLNANADSGLRGELGLD